LDRVLIINRRLGFESVTDFFVIQQLQLERKEALAIANAILLINYYL